MAGIGIQTRRKEVFRARPAVLWASAFLALLLQTFLPLTTPLARLFDFPLLITVYFSVLRQNKIFGIWFGTLLGIAQDALSHGYLGLMGMAKAVVGYVAAAAGIKLNLEGLFARAILAGFLVLIHDLFLFAVRYALFESPPPFRMLDLASSALLNMAAALLVYQVLDRFKQPS